MRHVRLTCKNHPALRWTTKSIATSPTGGYNGSRNIFFIGDENGNDRVAECTCPPDDLILAPEEKWDASCDD